MAQENPEHRDSATFGGEDWSTLWPAPPEPGLLAAFLADFTPDTPEARIHGLGHAYLSVAANEGTLTFQLLVLNAILMSGISAGLLTHLLRTRHLLVAIPLVATVLLAFYCGGYIVLKYRLRRLVYEIVRFCSVDLVLLLGRWRFEASKIAIGTPGWVLSKVLVIRSSRNGDDWGKVASESCETCKAMVSGSNLLGGWSGSISRLIRPFERWPHHNRQALLESSTACGLCHLLRCSANIDQTTAAPGNASGDQQTCLEVTITARRSWRTRTTDIRIQLEGDNITKVAPISAKYALHTLSRNEEQPLPPGESTWTIARQWIQNCRDSHNLCHHGSLHNGRMSIPSELVPPRLLELVNPATVVGTQETEKTDPSPETSFRLIDTTADTFQGHPDYLAFGPSFENVLDEKYPADTDSGTRLTSLESEMDFSPSVRQAVRIAKELGFRYLWINSLCAQANDSSSEGTGNRNGLVYSNAACAVINIVETEARPSTVDEYREKEEVVSDSSSLDLKHDPIKVAHRSFCSLDGLSRSIVSCDVATAFGFEFSERLLSPRVLFLRDGHPLFFECDTHQATMDSSGIAHFLNFGDPASEVEAKSAGASKHRTLPGLGALYTYQDRQKAVDVEKGAFKTETLVVPASPSCNVQSQLEKLRYIKGGSFRRHRGSLHRLVRNSNSGPSGPGQCSFGNGISHVQWGEKLDLNSAWFDLVNAYTSMEGVQTARARLEGMAEIASAIRLAHGGKGKYYSGLWMNLLPLNLLWCRDGATKGPIDSTSPTWSWAHVDAHIVHGLEGMEGRLRPKGHRAQGMIRGRLQYASDAVLSPADQRWRNFRVTPLIHEEFKIRSPGSNGGGPSLYIQHFCWLMHTVTLDSGQDGREGERPGGKCVRVFDRDEEPAEETVFGLPVLEISWMGNGKGVRGPSEVHGLLIVRKPEEFDGYRRVGYFRLERYSTADQMFVWATQGGWRKYLWLC
ncbi:hypothetical protein QBC39DRAFT_361698 [Podospora conica]|nr:hypothetical protein QBC39DRAFT_361698 [Schizothecium conicum]